MAEATGEDPRTRRRGPRSNWVPLGVAAGAVALLVVAWPLVNALLPASESVSSGDPVPVGSGGGYQASLTFPQEGWSLNTGASQAGHTYRFHRGPVELTLNSVTPATSPPPSVRELWKGMGRLIRAGEASARLSEPEAISTHDGDDGLAGTLESGSRRGTAVVYPSPNRRMAVEMTLAGREATTDDIAAVADVVRTVSFTREGS
ncbi:MULTISPECIES: hypothetical protein [Nocardiopsis]|uniref:Uncharacterized protein n=1 Tax=Nocardiopsis sinuspersici TaxID=501010 RepID=A0A1V3BXL5_9ACTN|nr:MULTISPECIES: hypothetical protein [Nocardiopsis]NYH54542.1 hypothetical protein [Nocardiopsis sinuspersici]OOC53307.1 hypothetical protein NOSIN_05350 [Nocardiopsis sinuspersici]